MNGSSQQTMDLIVRTRQRVHRLAIGMLIIGLTALTPLLSSDVSLATTPSSVNILFAGELEIIVYWSVFMPLLLLARIWMEICLTRLATLEEQENTIRMSVIGRLYPDNILLRYGFALLIFPFVPLVIYGITWKTGAVIPFGLFGALITATVVLLSLASLITFYLLNLWKNVGGLMMLFAVLVGMASMTYAYLLAEISLTPSRAFHLSGEDLSGKSIPHDTMNRMSARRADFSGVNLAGIQIMHADFTGSNFKGARLVNTGFSWSNLQGANLAGAKAHRVAFYDADLSNSVLRDADLTYAKFENANLTGADLSGADLTSSRLKGANLSGANLSGATLLEARELTQSQLDGACGDEKTKLPGGLHIGMCKPGP